MGRRSRNVAPTATAPSRACLYSRGPKLIKHAALAAGAFKYPMNVLMPCKLEHRALAVLETVNAKLARWLSTIGFRPLDVYAGPEAKFFERVAPLLLLPAVEFGNLLFKLRDAASRRTERIMQLCRPLLKVKDTIGQRYTDIADLLVRSERFDVLGNTECAFDGSEYRSRRNDFHERTPGSGRSNFDEDFTHGFGR